MDQNAISDIREKIRTEILRENYLSIINLVNYLVELAYNLKASDMHIVPTANFLRLRLRVDGSLHDEAPLPKIIHSEIISRIKILSNLRTDEHQVSQDGRFCTNLSGSNIDIRVSIVPTYYGEDVVLRLLVNNSQDFDLNVLGFSELSIEKIMKSVSRPHGMILVTGPTGSGKTTTLYTILKILNIPEVSIITIEDPIEYSIEGINQIGVNSKTGLTFANGLRSVLRQDPNIIMVGEIRDQETAGLAVNTALTGHLVLSTLHTNDAATTLPRLFDLKVEPYLIASTVNLVIGQRLVRKICTKCIKEIDSKKEIIDSLKGFVPSDVLSKKATFYKGDGCQECNFTGYRGRVCINEVLFLDNEIRRIINTKATVDEIRNQARMQGMKSIIEDGFNKASSGITTIEEILRVLHE